MKTIALVGASGTGKSHHALWVAHEYNVDALIDDGLLIQNHDIIAGISAKRQETAIGAIKTALFLDPDHASQVQKSLKKINPKCLLILGTSKEMTNRIATRLEIPLPSKYIDISEVISQKDIERAIRIRQQLGKHVIPAPTFAVKPRLSGILIDPLQVGFTKRQGSRLGKKLWVDQTVVKPTFNFYGKFYITDSALQGIVRYVVYQFNEVKKVHNIVFRNSSDGMTVSLDLVLQYGISIPIITNNIQKEIKTTLEHMTALHIINVDMYIRGLILP